jgi:hypothetical protein
LTSGLGVACICNFGKGLKPYVQRGAKKREMARIAELEKDANDNSWKIDED